MPALSRKGLRPHLVMPSWTKNPALETSGAGARRFGEEFVGLGEESLRNLPRKMCTAARFILERVEDAELCRTELYRVPGCCSRFTVGQRLSRLEERLEFRFLAGFS